MSARIEWDELAQSQGFPDGRAWLTYMYLEKRMHQHEIADHVGVSKDTVFRTFRMLGIPSRPNGGGEHGRRSRIAEWLRANRTKAETMTSREIADLAMRLTGKAYKKGIHTLLRDNNIEYVRMKLIYEKA